MTDETILPPGVSARELSAHYRRVRERMQRQRPTLLIALPVLPPPVPAKPKSPPPLVPAEDRFKTAVDFCMLLVDHLPLSKQCGSIMDSVARVYGLETADLVGRSHRSKLVEPRHLAMAICWALDRWSASHIARVFNHDRKIVLHAAHKYGDAVVCRLEERRMKTGRLA